jgi:hypothetical protein
MAKPIYATAETVSRPVAYMRVTKVIHEHIELRVRESYGETIGGLIDAHIASALEAGDELQSVTFDFAEGQWDEMRHKR